MKKSKHHGSYALPFLLTATVTIFSAAPSQAPPVGGDRQRIIKALRAANQLDSHRVLLSVNYACSLQINGESYPVVHVTEAIPGASFHGYIRTIIFKPDLQIAQVITDNSDQEPLVCVDNHLYLSDHVAVGNEPPGDNVWTFTDPTGDYSYQRVDPAKWPTAASFSQVNPKSPAIGSDTQKLLHSLQTSGELHPDRIFAGVVHLCNLQIDGAWYPVASIDEHIPSSTIKKDWRLVIFKPNLEVAQVIRDHSNTTPTFCIGNQLYVINGDQTESDPEGDYVWTFTNAGTKFTVKPTDRRHWPTEADRRYQFQ